MIKFCMAAFLLILAGCAGVESNAGRTGDLQLSSTCATGSADEEREFVFLNSDEPPRYKIEAVASKGIVEVSDSVLSCFHRVSGFSRAFVLKSPPQYLWGAVGSPFAHRFSEKLDDLDAKCFDSLIDNGKYLSFSNSIEISRCWGFVVANTAETEIHYDGMVFSLYIVDDEAFLWNRLDEESYLKRRAAGR